MKNSLPPLAGGNMQCSIVYHMHNTTYFSSIQHGAASQEMQRIPTTSNAMRLTWSRFAIGLKLGFDLNA